METRSRHGGGDTKGAIMVEFSTKVELGEEVRLVRRVMADGKRGVWLKATPEAIAKCEERSDLPAS